MVVGVIILVAASGNNAPRSSIATARRFYRVFSVVTALAKRQALLIIAEDDAVARIGKRSVLFDQRQRLACLVGQFGC